jgi:hypothetical protein
VRVCWRSSPIAIVRSNTCVGRRSFSARQKRLPVPAVAWRVAGVSRPAFWRWQARYAKQGADGLLRDKV